MATDDTLIYHATLDALLPDGTKRRIYDGGATTPGTSLATPLIDFEQARLLPWNVASVRATITDSAGKTTVRTVDVVRDSSKPMALRASLGATPGTVVLAANWDASYSPYTCSLQGSPDGGATWTSIAVPAGAPCTGRYLYGTWSATLPFSLVAGRVAEFRLRLVGAGWATDWMWSAVPVPAASFEDPSVKRFVVGGRTMVWVDATVTSPRGWDACELNLAASGSLSWAATPLTQTCSAGLGTQHLAIASVSAAGSTSIHFARLRLHQRGGTWTPWRMVAVWQCVGDHYNNSCTG